MGGHHSKQTVDVSTSIVTKASLNATQNCLSYVAGQQVIGVFGKDITFSGNVQKATLSVDSDCVSKMGQDGKFESALNSSISQSLKDQEVAMTEWMDSSSDTQNTAIHNSISTSISFNDVQNCLNAISGDQIMVVRGDDIIVKDNLQEQTISLASNCLMKGGQAVQSANDVTNTTNQHSDYTSKNPLSFITDAIEAMFGSVAGVAAVAFIIVVILVLVYKGLHGKKSGRQGPIIIGDLKGLGLGKPEPPGAEAPGAEPPGAEAPGAEAPGAEAPGAEAPGAEAPGAEAPGAEAPGAEAPGAEPPGAASPPAYRPEKAE